MVGIGIFFSERVSDLSQNPLSQYPRNTESSFPVFLHFVDFEELDALLVVQPVQRLPHNRPGVGREAARQREQARLAHDHD